MVSFVAVLPAIDLELASCCIRSMDQSLRDRTILCDNTLDRSIYRTLGEHIALPVSYRENIGVPASWNAGIAYANQENADYLVIVSQSIRFGRHAGHDFIAELHRRKPEVLMHSQHGWKLLALARKTWETVGLFDPVFTPGYMEDTDYLYRMGLAGLPSPRENGGELDQINVDASSAGDAQALLRGHVQVDMRLQADRYFDKWAGAQGEERWRQPYNDPTLDFTHIGGPRT